MLKNTEKKVICFGTGLMAEEALGYSIIRDRISCFMDNDTSKQGKKMMLSGQKFPVLAPVDVIEQVDEQTIILLVSGYYHVMEEQLRELGIPEFVEIYAYPVMKVAYRTDSERFFEQRILSECLKEYEIVLDQYHIVGEERERCLQEKKNI